MAATTGVELSVALVVPLLGRDPAENLEALRRGVSEAGETDLVLLPEAALSPFPTGKDVAKDLPCGEPVPGPATNALGDAARESGAWVGFGLIERVDDGLYDSAVLLDPDGRIALHYRRVHPGWFYPDADRFVYRCGDDVPSAATPWGNVAFLICGDLFDDAVVDRVPDCDFLLVPFARSLPGDDMAVWEREEVPTYAERVARAGVPTLLVNRIGGAFVGGAMAVDQDGRVLSALPPGRPGVLHVKLR